MKRCLIFSGPSGAGKSTLMNHVLETTQYVGVTVSCTTRAPRKSEVDGVNYHFVSNEKFDDLIRRGEFIEYVECYSNRYGTLKSAVSDILKDNDICILDLDFAGAYQILAHNIVPEFNFEGVLILPPSMRSLRARLLGRGTETEESLKTRLHESFDIKNIAAYKYIIINNDLEKAKSELSWTLEKSRNL
ncbi:MAG: guanylate kinase [Holosporales bacterium]|jgi:guanylate kinase|nr:guanylate kinase [Holosporales bacterium]